MNERRLEAGLIDWYSRVGEAAAPQRLRDAVLGLPDLDIDAIAVRRPWTDVWGRHGTRSSLPLAIAAAAAVVVVIVGISLLSDGRVVGGPTTSTQASSSRAPNPSTVPSSSSNPGLLELTPGPFDIRWPGASIHLTLPAGWASSASLTAICQPDPPDTRPGDRSPSDCADGNRPNLRIHDVTGVATDTCPATPGSFVEVGPSMRDFTTALRDQVGPVRRSGPNYIKLGGFPAERFNLTYDFSYPCPAGPEGREVWIDRDGSQFTQFKDGTGTVYVVDVDGDRVVMTTHYRGASAEDIAELDAIVASMRIQPMAAELRGGGLSVHMDGVSFTVGPSPLLFPAGWGRFGSISVNKSIIGPQGAEAMVYWTTFPEGDTAEACGHLKDRPADATAADLADAVSTAPGIELITSPEDVTVGGRPAKHVVVKVREDLGCDPGYFFTWHDRWGGPVWSTTDAGDTIQVWIVDVDGARLFIAGEIHGDRSTSSDRPLTDDERTGLDQEIQQIVDSIKFE